MRIGKNIKIIILTSLLLVVAYIYLEQNIFLIKIILSTFIACIIRISYLIIKSYIEEIKKYKFINRVYSMSIESIDGDIWSWNDFTKEIYLSDRLRSILGLTDNVITLDKWFENVANEDLDRVRNYFNNLCLNRTCLETEIEYRVKDLNKNEMSIKYVGKSKIQDDVYYLSGLITDVTKKNIQNQMNLNPANFYDDVTGTPTRKYFIKELEIMMRKSLVDKTNLALIFIDIDNFKNINDTYGYDVGDSILINICNVFNKVLNTDCKFARFCADEFVIAVPNIEKESETNEIIQKIIGCMKDLVNIDGKDIYCSCSIGISIYPNDADRVDLLIKTANMAMCKAKINGKNRYEFFDDRALKELKRQNEIEKALRGAINNKEIYMMFQPQIRSNGEGIHGFEALVRWQSNELGFVSPAEFIPVAENTGMIVDLGKYIIEESFKGCKELSLLTKEKFIIAINISEVQLRDEQFSTFIFNLLEKYELSSSYIEFEITESVIMKSVSRNIEKLSQLRELGVTIALDDFGTGYSSLNYLRRLPIDVVKVDKSFVDGIGVDEKSERIAESIIKLSHSLDLMVVAEGVETREQLGYLNRMNCDIIQGYYFSKPEKFNKIKEMIVN